jgi:CDP-diacylglycerol--glycerol-3-phosphate 3-phosphatidyltransferase
MSTTQPNPDAERIGTASNLLSLLRLVLVIPAGLALWNGMRVLTLALFVLAAITDVLDGNLARRFNEISELGKILDPLADKIFVGTIVILMLALGMLPLWFVAVVLFRDVAIFFGGLYIKKRNGEVLPSNYAGKIAVLILSLTLLLIVAGVTPTIIDILMGISLLLLAISFTLYLRRAIQVVKAPEGALTTAGPKP